MVFTSNGGFSISSFLDKYEEPGTNTKPSSDGNEKRTSASSSSRLNDRFRSDGKNGASSDHSSLTRPFSTTNLSTSSLSKQPAPTSSSSSSKPSLEGKTKVHRTPEEKAAILEKKRKLEELKERKAALEAAKAAKAAREAQASSKAATLKKASNQQTKAPATDSYQAMMARAKERAAQQAQAGLMKIVHKAHPGQQEKAEREKWLKEQKLAKLKGEKLPERPAAVSNAKKPLPSSALKGVKATSAMTSSTGSSSSSLKRKREDVSPKAKPRADKAGKVEWKGMARETKPLKPSVSKAEKVEWKGTSREASKPSKVEYRGTARYAEPPRQRQREREREREREPAYNKRYHYAEDDDEDEDDYYSDESSDMEATGADIFEEEERSRRAAVEDDKREEAMEQRRMAEKAALKKGMPGGRR